MENQENSVMIFDSTNNYDELNLIDDKLNVIHAKNDYEQGLNTVRKMKPDMLAKVISENDPYTFRETLDFLKNVKKLSKDTRLLVINVENDKDKIYQLINVGVDGVCDGKITTLSHALKSMQEYQVFISFSYQKALIEEFKSSPQPRGKTTLRINKPVAREILTNREVEVLEDLILNEGNQEERANRLFISPKTLKNHMAKIMDKLYADNRTHIIPIAIKKGIIEANKERVTH